jgi:hypothetical protein
MDYLSWFFVESKAFELSVPERGFFMRLVERRHGLARVMVVGKYSVAWLKKAVEKMVSLAVDSAFTDSLREGHRAFFAQKGSNRASR